MDDLLFLTAPRMRLTELCKGTPAQGGGRGHHHKATKKQNSEPVNYAVSKPGSGRKPKPNWVQGCHVFSPNTLEAGVGGASSLEFEASLFYRVSSKLEVSLSYRDQKQWRPSLYNNEIEKA